VAVAVVCAAADLKTTRPPAVVPVASAAIGRRSYSAGQVVTGTMDTSSASPGAAWSWCASTRRTIHARYRSTWTWRRTVLWTPGIRSHGARPPTAVGFHPPLLRTGNSQIRS